MGLAFRLLSRARERPPDTRADIHAEGADVHIGEQLRVEMDEPPYRTSPRPPRSGTTTSIDSSPRQATICPGSTSCSETRTLTTPRRWIGITVAARQRLAGQLCLDRMMHAVKLGQDGSLITCISATPGHRGPPLLTWHRRQSSRSTGRRWAPAL